MSDAGLGLAASLRAQFIRSVMDDQHFAHGRVDLEGDDVVLQADPDSGLLVVRLGRRHGDDAFPDLPARTVRVELPIDVIQRWSMTWASRGRAVFGDQLPVQEAALSALGMWFDETTQSLTASRSDVLRIDDSGLFAYAGTGLARGRIPGAGV